MHWQNNFLFSTSLHTRYTQVPGSAWVTVVPLAVAAFSSHASWPLLGQQFSYGPCSHTTLSPGHTPGAAPLASAPAWAAAQRCPSSYSRVVFSTSHLLPPPAMAGVAPFYPPLLPYFKLTGSLNSSGQFRGTTAASLWFPFWL